jgi:hypothetical protein
MASYAEDLARWRAERKQAEISNRLEEIKQEHAQAARERDTAIANNDLETAEWRDGDCERLEQEWNQYVPPQRPQMDPRAADWVQRNAPFFERHGDQKASKAVLDWVYYMMRPKNPNTNNPAYTGMGLTYEQVVSPQGKKILEELLETHGQAFHNVRFDPNEQTITATEAAKISGVSPQTYNNASRELARDGRFGFQQKR